MRRPTIGERYVGILLWAYPREFRQRCREEILGYVQHERGRKRFRGIIGAIRFWMSVTGDLLLGIVRTRRPWPTERPSVAFILRGDNMVTTFFGDLRSAWRSVRATPAVSTVVVLTVAVAIGMSTSIFTVVNAVLLEPLGYHNPDELVHIDIALEADDQQGIMLSGGDFRDIREHADVFADVAGIGRIRQNLTGIGHARQVNVGWVSTNFMEMLGLRVEVGRIFQAADPPGVAIISHGLWVQEFGSDSSVAGSTMQLDGRTYTVVGVMAPSTKVLIGRSLEIDVWKVPDDWWQNGDVWNLQGPNYGLLRVVGRVRPGISLEAVRTALAVVATDIRQRIPAYEAAGLAFRVTPLRASVVRDVQSTLLMLLGAVAVVVLIACANVMNLMLARGLTRQHDLNVRLALGATRVRLAVMVFLESALLAAAGAAIGLMVALQSTKALVALVPRQLPLAGDMGIDLTVLAFAALVTMSCTMLFGMVPALAVVRHRVVTGGQVRVAGSRSGQRLSRSLVVAQLGLSLTLLIGAALLTQSFIGLRSESLGFRADNLMTFAVSLPGTRYERPVGTDRFFRDLEQQIEQLPGVTAAGVVWPMPLVGTWSGLYAGGLTLEEQRASAEYRVATPNLFVTMGNDLVEGQTFGSTNAETSVIVSRNVSERAWPGQSAVGQTIMADPWSRGTLSPFEVIGVVDNVRYRNVRSAADETVYFDSAGWSWTDWEMHVLVRTTVDPMTIAEPVRAIVARMDSELPVANLQLMSDRVTNHLAADRFAMTLIGVFALVALCLAAVGLYGVLAVAVRRRNREIGIRIALGSDRRRVFTLILGQGARLIGSGIVLGGLAALGLTRLLSTLLYDVAPTDGETYVAVAIMLSLVSLVACLLPARRATAVDPVVVMRQE